MTIHNLSATDAHTSEEAHDLQTLLFIDLHTSLGAEPEDIPEAERLSESDHHDIHLDPHWWRRCSSVQVRQYSRMLLVLPLP